MTHGTAIRALGLLLAAACAPAPAERAATATDTGAGAGPDPAAELTVTEIQRGVFVVSGSGAGEISWCAAGRHGRDTLGLGGRAEITRVSSIPADGMSLGTSRIEGPGVLYTTGRGSVFEFAKSRIAEERSVTAALAACG